MRFSHDLSYEASPSEVLEMLGDPAFREMVCEAMHAVRRDVSVQGSGSGMSVVVDQTQPAKGIPSFAKKFVGDQIQIVQREAWKDESGASLHVGIPGKPGSLKGAIALAADGDGTVESVTGDIKVKVPMVAGRLEKLIGDLGLLPPGRGGGGVGLSCRRGGGGGAPPPRAGGGVRGRPPNRSFSPPRKTGAAFSAFSGPNGGVGFFGGGGPCYPPSDFGGTRVPFWGTLPPPPPSIPGGPVRSLSMYG